jgi:hypothetical protein
VPQLSGFPLAAWRLGSARPPAEILECVCYMIPWWSSAEKTDILLQIAKDCQILEFPIHRPSVLGIGFGSCKETSMIHSVRWLVLGSTVLVIGLTGGATAFGQEPNQDEIVIDRLLAIVKDENASIDQRANACLSLGKRGDKARKAVPAMIKLLDTLFQGSQNYNAYAGAVAKAAEGVGDMKLDAKDAVPVLAKIVKEGVKDSSAGAKPEIADAAAAEALGKIPVPAAFDALANASTNERSVAIRIGAVRGLGHMAVGPDAGLRAKAMAQLKVVEETETNPRVQGEVKGVRKFVKKLEKGD